MVKLPTKVHPIAALFPMMSDEELQQLAEDIRQNGLISPIIVDNDNQLIDGRNRLAACKLAEVEPRFEQLDGRDPLAYIVSANLARRNLSKGQRAMVLAMIYPEPKRGIHSELRNSTGKLGFDKSRLSQARTVLRNSQPLAGAVLKGEKDLDSAYEQIQQQEREAKQREIDMQRLRKEAPDLADKVEEGKLRLDQAMQTLAEQLAYRRQICDDGRDAVRRIREFPVMVESIAHAMEFGEKELLTEELIQDAIEAAKRLPSLLTQQEK